MSWRDASGNRRGEDEEYSSVQAELKPVSGEPPTPPRCNCGADRTGPSAEAHTDTCPESGEPFPESQTAREDELFNGICDDLGYGRHWHKTDGYTARQILNRFEAYASALRERAEELEKAAKYWKDKYEQLMREV